MSGRFVMGASVLSDDYVAWLLKNENQAEIPELLWLAANLGRDQRLALTESAKTDAELIPLRGKLAAEQERIWKDEYDIKIDLAELLIPRTPLGRKHRLLVMVEQVAQSAEFFYQSDKKVYDGKVWKFTDKSLDDVEMTHKHTGTFGFWLADEQEAPDGCLGKGTSSPINLHAAAVRELGWTTTTVPMRQLFGRAYRREHGVHPDQTVLTFCADSALPGSFVPYMDFGRSVGTVRVNFNDVLYAGGRVRFRRAVVPSKLKSCSLPN